MGDETPSSRAVVRRAASATPLDSPFVNGLLTSAEHAGHFFRVDVDVIWPIITAGSELRGPPQIRLRWTSPSQPGKVIGFRRRNGFGIEKDYGERIIISALAGEKVETLEPGDYFYTFLLRTSLLGLFWLYTGEIQFSATVPSIAKSLELVRGAIEYRKLQQEYEALTAPPPKKKRPKKEEPPLTRFKREFAEAMTDAETKIDAAERLRQEWDRMKREIKDGQYTPEERKRRLRALNGVMRELRERFEL